MGSRRVVVRLKSPNLSLTVTQGRLRAVYASEATRFVLEKQHTRRDFSTASRPSTHLYTSNKFKTKSAPQEHKTHPEEGFFLPQASKCSMMQHGGKFKTKKQKLHSSFNVPWKRRFENWTSSIYFESSRTASLCRVNRLHGNRRITQRWTISRGNKRKPVSWNGQIRLIKFQARKKNHINKHSLVVFQFITPPCQQLSF